MKKVIVCLVALSVILSVLLPITLVSAQTDTGFYKITFDGKTTGGPFYTLTDDMKVETKDVSVNFRYCLEGDKGEVALVNLANSETLLNMNKGWNNCSVKLDGYSGNLCLGIRVVDATAKSDAVVYLKNVSITVGGVNKFNATATQFFSNDPAKLKFVNESDLPEDTGVNDLPAYLVEFNNSPVGKGIWLGGTEGDGKNKEFVVSFDYYLIDAEDGELYVGNARGGSFSNDSTGDYKLLKGEHNFTSTVANYQFENGYPAIGSLKRTNAKIYIWNVSVTIGGKDYTNFNTSAWNDGSVDFSSITYGDIPFDNGSGGGSGEGDGESTENDTYLVEFDNSPAEKGIWLGGTEGDAKNKKIVVSFEYYLTDVQGGGVYVGNARGGSFNDDVTGVSKLSAGKHKFTSTVSDYQFENMYPTIGSGAETTAKIYVWNVSVTINGVDYTKVDANPWKHDSVKFTEMKYEDIPFDDGDGSGSGDTGSGDGGDSGSETENDTYLVEFDNSPAEKGIWLGGTEGDAKNKKIVVSFEYYLTDVQGGGVYVGNARGGSFNDDVTGVSKLSAGKHKFTSTVSDYQFENMYPTITNNTVTTAKVYIWNVSVTINGVDYTKVDANPWKHDSVKFTEMKYEDIPFDTGSGSGSNSGGDSGSSSGTNNDAYLITFNKTPLEKGIWLGGTESDAQNKKIVVSFEYYLTDVESGELFVGNARGGSFNDDTTGNNKLSLGKNKFKATVNNYQFENMYPTIGSNAQTTAKLYIWNVSVTINGVDYTNFNTSAWNDGTVKFTTMKYKDIPFKAGATTDGAYLDVADKYMLLQKNYCYDEEKGVLQYLVCHHMFGKKQNGSEIKPETEYVLSFDYYADPGEFDAGVMGNTAAICTLDTGYNDYFTKSYMAMIWNEETQKYGGIPLPNKGYKHIEVTFKTLKNQTDFFLSLESGTEGNAYYWNFNLVEKGTTKNLFTYSSFIYPDIHDISAAKLGSKGWHMTEEAMKYSYEFVEFKDEFANLKEGEVVGGTVDNNGDEESKPGNTVPIIPSFDDNTVQEESGMPLFVIIIIIAGSVLVLGGATATLIILNKKGIIKFKK